MSRSMTSSRALPAGAAAVPPGAVVLWLPVPIGATVVVDFLSLPHDATMIAATARYETSFARFRAPTCRRTVVPPCSIAAVAAPLSPPTIRYQVDEARRRSWQN